MLQIANINLPGNLVLSPMAGVTDAPFRQICRSNGADYTVSEMITSDLALWYTKKTQNRLSDKWETYPKIIQIAGASKEIVVNAAIKCQEIGANIIEINMGCPAKKVCNVLAGSALLRDEILVGNILYNVCKNVSIPVTLKTRLGWDHNHKNILTIAKIAQESGIKSITIHGRTRCDLYNGFASYELITDVKNQLTIPIFANGDINTPEKAKEVLDYTKADGLYIGRGALGKPWLFRQIKEYLQTNNYQEVSLNELHNTIINHLNLIYEHYDEYTASRMIRKHVKWYSQKNSLLINTLDLSIFNKLETYKSQLEHIYQIFSNI